MKITNINTVSSHENTIEYGEPFGACQKSKLRDAIVNKVEHELNNCQEYKELERDYAEAFRDRDFISCTEIINQMKVYIVVTCYKTIFNSL